MDLNRIPQELYHTHILPHIPTAQLKNLRRLNHRLNSLVTDKVYKLYYLQIFKGSVIANDTETLKMIYGYFDPEIQDKMRKSNLFNLPNCFTHFKLTVAFSFAASNGNSEMAKLLYSWTRKDSEDDDKSIINELRSMLKVGDFHSFRRACQTGDLNLAEDLYSWCYDADKQLMIRARSYEAFIMACINNHMDVAHKLFEWCDESKRQDMIESRDYHAFARSVDVNVMTMLYLCCKEEKRSLMLSAQENRAFKEACRSGNVEIVKLLHSWNNESDREKMIRCNDFQAFKNAAQSGSLELILLVYSWYPESHKTLIIESEGFKAFRNAAKGGSLELIQRIYSWCPDSKKSLMIKSEEFHSFANAAKNGHLHIVNQIYSWCDINDRGDMIKAHDYFPFRMAIRSGRVEVVEQIYNWCEDKSKILESGKFRYLHNIEHLNVLLYVYSLRNDDNQKKIFFENAVILMENAAKKGLLEIMKGTRDLYRREGAWFADKRRDMSYGIIAPLQAALNNKNRYICQEILSWCGDEDLRHVQMILSRPICGLAARGEIEWFSYAISWFDAVYDVQDSLLTYAVEFDYFGQAFKNHHFNVCRKIYVMSSKKMKARIEREFDVGKFMK